MFQTSTLKVEGDSETSAKSLAWLGWLSTKNLTDRRTSRIANSRKTHSYEIKIVLRYLLRV